MAEYSGEQTVVIQAPVDAVYEYISDFQRHPEWNFQPTEITKISEGPAGVGTVYRTKEQMGSVTPWLLKLLHPLLDPFFKLVMGTMGYTVAEITALEPDRRVAWKAFQPTKKQGNLIEAEWEIRLQTRGKGTEVVQWYHFNFLGKMGERVNPKTMGSMTAREVARNLDRLKTLVEEQTAPGRASHRAAFA